MDVEAAEYGSLSISSSAGVLSWVQDRTSDNKQDLLLHTDMTQGKLDSGMGVAVQNDFTHRFYT